MLKKSKISPIKILSDDWHEQRRTRMTSSRISVICAERGIGEGGLNYIKDKVGEELTGKSADKEFDTEGVRWGHFYEAEGVQKFGKAKGLSFLVTQQLLYEPGERFASTPDALIVISETPDGTGYNVEPVEGKCPPTFNVFISLFMCNTPQDLKKVNRDFYFQHLDQIDHCGSTQGHWFVYHPEFRSGNMKIIDFDTHLPVLDKFGKPTFPLHEDLKLLRERKKEAEEKYYEIRDKLIKAGKI